MRQQNVAAFTNPVKAFPHQAVNDHNDDGHSKRCRQQQIKSASIRSLADNRAETYGRKRVTT
ncbi:MAG: hypothetical protein ACRD1O_04715 [Terriglobia bacterium]